jgi:hypothetical protein
MKGKGTKRSDERQGEMRSEYNFDYNKAVRGKYYRRVAEERSNVVVLDPDVAQRFRTSAAVNKALRELLKARRSTNTDKRERSKRKELTAKR